MKAGHPHQSLIDAMLESVWLVEPSELRIVAVNRAAEELLLLPAHALVGRPVVDLAHTSQDLFFWEDVAAGAGSSIHSETLLNRSDGGMAKVDRRVSRVPSGDGGALYLVAMQDLSAQHRVETELETIIAELRATLDSTADGILVTDMEGGIRGYNRRFAEMWSLPEDLLTRRDDRAVFEWMGSRVQDAEGYAERFTRIQDSPLLEAEDRLVLADGRVLQRVSLPQYARGRPIGRVYSFHDITQQLADEVQLRLAAKVFDSSLDAIFVADAGFRILAANPAFLRQSGSEPGQVLGRPAYAFLSDPRENRVAERIAAGLEEKGAWEGEVWARRQGGDAYPCLLSIVMLPEEVAGSEEALPLPEGVQGRARFVGFFKDLTEAVAAKKRIEELAFTDALTGLPNRTLLRERFEFAIGHARRGHNQLAVLFIDLDRFKHINDSLGHAVGDKVLVEVASRLQQCLRQIDTASRVGGDEFVLLLAQVDGTGAETVARRTLNAMLRPIVVDGMSFSLTCSIGISMYPEDGQDMDELIKNADSAMYAVKERGRSDFRFYQRQMNIGLLSRMKLDQALRIALEEGGLRLHYQPKICLQTGRLLGMEALCRWRDPEFGDVPPDRFIPVAEETGAIIPLGRWVVDEALRQIAAWREAGFTVPVAVNVSANQFHQNRFVEAVAEALQRHDVPGKLLELELTESILITDVDEVIRRLDALSELGVTLSIDDFGTGYSSFSYLKRFPIRRLKIDRSFLADVPGNGDDEAIVNAVVQLGKALRISVIAEGVETEAQRQFLLAKGCGEGQGYLFSPPLEAERVLALYGHAGQVSIDAEQ